MKSSAPRSPSRRQWLAQGGALLGASIAGPAAWAQASGSNTPIRILVGASPGGSTDTLARAVGAASSGFSGQ